MLKAIIYWWNKPVLPTIFFVSPSARELELEDRQSRLQQELRERMAVEGEFRSSPVTLALSIYTGAICSLFIAL